MSRPGMTVILGVTEKDALTWKRDVPELSAVPIGVSGKWYVYSLRIARVYITPQAAELIPHDASVKRAFLLLKKHMEKTPGADESVIYLEDK